MAEEYRRPGWYPAPDGAPGERWWNGAFWSESVRGGTAAPPPAPAVVYSSGNPAPQRPEPYAAPAPPTAPGVAVNAGRSGVAVAALVLGMLSTFGFSILGPIAVVLSLVGIARARRLTVKPGSSTGIVVAAVGLVTGAIGTVMLVATAITFVSSIVVDFR
ncbi:hypothetical protein BH09ACT5_BH09ACT5_16950 [soil metagenome]